MRSLIMVPASAIRLPLPSSETSEASTRPNTRSPRGAMMSPPSMIGAIVKPCTVPQSCSVITKSCEMSTKRLVR